MGKLDSLEKPLQRPGGSSNNNNNNNANGDVLTLSKTPERVKRDEWSEGAVTTLLDAYESKWLLRNRAKLKGNDWEDVARHVSTRANGTKSTKTQTQCKNKIESMKKRYRAEAATLNGSNSNTNGSSWPLYSRLDGLLRCRTAAGDAIPSPCANAIGNPPPDLALLESPTPPPPPPPPPPLPPVEERERQAEGQGQRQGQEQEQEQGQEQGQGQAQKQEEVELVRVAATVAAAQDSNQADDGSNTLPNRKESAALDTDTSTPRSKIAHAPCDGSGKGVANNYSCKRRKSSGGGGGGGSSEVAESIRSFADSIVKLEQAKMRLYKDSERLRAETEVRRGEMELKRTEIIAKTQLQIARLLSGKNGKRKLTDRNTNTSTTTLALTTAPLPPEAAAHAPPPRSLLGK